MPRNTTILGPEHRAVLGVLRRNRGLVAGLAGASLAGGLAMLAVPYLTRLQIEVLEGRGEPGPWLPGRSPLFLLVLAAAVLALGQLLGWSLAELDRVLQARSREKLAVDTERVLYEKLATLDSGFLENPRNRRIIYVLFDIGNLSQEALSLGVMLGQVLVTAAGVLPLLLLLDPWVFLCVCGASSLQAAVIRLRMRRENSFRLAKERRLVRVNELRFLLRHHFHRLLGVAGEERVMPRFWQMRAEAVNLEAAHAMLRARYSVLYTLLGRLAELAVAVLVGSRVLQGEITIGAFTMVLLYAQRLTYIVDISNDSLGEWFRLRSVFCQLGFFLRLEPRLRSAGAPAPVPRGDIVARDLCFAYPELSGGERAYLEHLVRVLQLGQRWQPSYIVDIDLASEWRRLLEEGSRQQPRVLRGVSCAFPRGRLTALVGRNGSGKTTLLNLLMRAHDPDSGQLLLGETPLERILPRDLRRAVSLVPQVPFLMESFSLRDNLLLGVEGEPPEERLWEVLEQVGLADALGPIHGGLDALLGDEVNLSGGEGQLLVIARVVLQQRPYLLLDEGTNQLDAEHELRVVELLTRLKAHTALVVVTHRMTTARRADHILVLDGGRIIESGSHQELLEQEDGLYRRFWEIQVVR